MTAMADGEVFEPLVKLPDGTTGIVDRRAIPDRSTIELVQQQSELAVHQAEVFKWRARALWGLVALALAGIVAMSVMLVMRANDDARQAARDARAAAEQARMNGEQLVQTLTRLDEVEADLNAARAILATDNQEDADRDICGGRFEAGVDKAERDHSAAFGRLVVVATRGSDIPGVDRSAAIDEAVAEVDAALVALDEAIQRELDWQTNPALPCPIPEPLRSDVMVP